jgi:polyisoprenoid-binding protein YceI
MMKKFVAIGLAALVAVAILAGVVAYGYLKPAEAASGPIEAVALTQTSAGATTTYTIAQASSQATFTIGEVLNGAPKTVVGTTNQVAGQIAVDPSAPGTAQLGTITIDARTLSTDSDQRNNAIKNMILKTNDNEYITFVPTAITGLPASATAGQSYSFQVIGQLTIAGQAHAATFAVTVTPTADGQLQGTATTTIKYADWGVSIPSVPFVTGVSDTVTLALDFAATAN